MIFAVNSRWYLLKPSKVKVISAIICQTVFSNLLFNKEMVRDLVCLIELWMHAGGCGLCSSAGHTIVNLIACLFDGHMRLSIGLCKFNRSDQAHA